MKPGPLTSTAGAHVGDVERVHEGLGDVAGRPAQPLRQAQRDVRLVVGELRRPDQRIGVGVLRAERGGERTLDAFGEHELAGRP